MIDRFGDNKIKFKKRRANFVELVYFDYFGIVLYVAMIFSKNEKERNVKNGVLKGNINM